MKYMQGDEVPVYGTTKSFTRASYSPKWHEAVTARGSDQRTGYEEVPGQTPVSESGWTSNSTT
jgi:hypothetical protein